MLLPVKIITGIRRCGKSSLMKLMIEHLKNSGITENQIIEMNFESMNYRNMTAIVDIGLRNYLLDFRDMDTGHIIENIVYFELLRRGYDVAIGKVDEKEIDFIATNADTKRYIQVTESMNEQSTRERELAPLRKIRDNYEKMVIANECTERVTQDGIKIVKLTDFLLDENG